MLDRIANKCQFEEVCVQLTTWFPDYDFDMQRLRIILARDRKFSIDAYNELTAQDAARWDLAKFHRHCAQMKTPHPPISGNDAATHPPPLIEH